MRWAEADGMGPTWTYGKDWIVLSWFETGWIRACLVVVFIVLLWIELEQTLTGAELDGIGLSWIQLDAVGLSWIQLGSVGFDSTTTNWIELGWSELGTVGLAWVELDSRGLN